MFNSKNAYTNIDPAQPNTSRQTVLLLVAVIVGPLLLLLILRFVGTGRLNLTLPGDGKTYTIEAVNQSDGKVVTSKSTTGASFSTSLRTGDYEIRVLADDNRASSYALSVPRFYGKVSRDVAMQNRAPRQKLARGTMSCPLLAADGIHSYTCGFSEVIAKHTPVTKTTYSERQDIPLAGTIAASAYRDGIIALQFASSAEKPQQLILNFIKDGRVVTSKTLPDSFTVATTETADYRLTMDKDNDQAFAVSKTDSAIAVLYYSSLEAEPVGTNSLFDEVSEEEIATSFDLADGTLLIGFGESAHGHHDDEKTPKKSSTRDTVVRIVNATNTDGRAEEYKTDEAFSSILLCGDGRICILQEGELILYRYGEEELTQLAAFQNVDNVLSGSESTITYLQKNRVYKLDADTLEARLLYGSANFTVTDIHPAGKDILLSALVTNDKDSLVEHAFLVNTSELAPSNEFIDDSLPYVHESHRDIYDMDFYDRTLLVTVFLDSATQGSNDRAAYDKQEFDQVTSGLLQEFASDGVDEPNYSIHFNVTY